MNNPPKKILRSKDTEIDIAPAASPPINEDIIEKWPNFWITHQP